MSNPQKLQRIDIQALRGLAVLMVVFYHIKIGSLKAGYLGVDVFFVISGFLITTLVATGINQGSFSIPNFYFRRAKRLLPAAYATFLATAVAAPWFLNQQELRDFSTQIIGAVTFTGNIVLWQQTGYFEGAADLKPLLHVWSLAIEEQYYFLLPAALLLTRPSRWLLGAKVVVFVSLGLCISAGIWKPTATFYLLPTRAWELVAGSLGALWLLPARGDRNQVVANGIRLLFVPSILCLLVLPVAPFVGAHPGLNAFLMCVATLTVILRNSPGVNAAFPTRLLAHFGDFSYSLYLVHWPVLAFMKNAWVGSSPELPIRLRLAALALSFLFAFLLYRLVEDPVRKSRLRLSKALIGKVAVTSLMLVSITPVAMYAMPAKLDFRDLRQPNYGFGKACEYEGLYTPRKECQNSEKPTLLVWGDSYAMHLVPGLEAEWGRGGLVQATRSSCGPFLGLAPHRIVHPGRGTVMDQAWAESCIGFNQSVIDFLRTASAIETVVLSTPFATYVTEENFEHVVLRGSRFESLPVTSAVALASMRHTIDAIRALGKKVVLIAPPPSADFDIGGCLERQISGTVMFGGQKGCAIDRANYLSKSAGPLAFLDSISSVADVSVIRFDSWLCNPSTCATLLDGTMIYRDTGHLSFAGSKFMAKRMHLAKLIIDQSK